MNWQKVLIINDGSPATQSDFNDGVVREALELYLISLSRANRYTVVSQGEPQKLSPIQKSLVDSLIEELNFFLLKKGVVTRLLEERGQEEVFGDELRRILESAGKTIQKWGRYEAIIDGEKVFIRPRSKKPKGWQITFRGRKEGSFIDCLQKGIGCLLFSRNSVLLIPLEVVRGVIEDDSAYKQDTIDVRMVIDEDGVSLRYKEDQIDVTEYKLLD